MSAALVGRGRRGAAGPTAGRRLLGVLAVAVSLVWVFPVYWMISSAFLPTNELRTSEPTFFPSRAGWATSGGCSPTRRSTPPSRSPWRSRGSPWWPRSSSHSSPRWR
ncbi:hypothetical protein [Blastococcus brunescens]|uniref:Carbohydrate ABC transporter permease n=1 Tax=Blastococcus brunescens TaxID=1564165 RepID=A0ABZ1B388_9ACTN|nr:hypothetical protein [Blastococcus sp. BMG 8361]WRL64238.1 hypothetical protein U6N30_32610 [Blastococcus sp. BMG 8361]